MTEAEVWQQIEQYAIEGNWTGVGVLGDWLQEQGIAEGETVCWWAKQQEPESWIGQDDGFWSILAPAFFPSGGRFFLPSAIGALHRVRIRLKALLT